jgi:O-acetyl-ADP-ribose deacetylase (regulator of RNase III)
MITYSEGNLLESKAEALVNTVNTVGVMGKGIALQFKNQFPENYKTYVKACKDGTLKTGLLLVTEETTLLNGKKWIVNFPTKTDWRKPSEYEYIESGLQELVRVISEKNIKSIALPALGAGNGGLLWQEVKALIEKYLEHIECAVFVYEPNQQIKEVLKKERVKLTPPRAMLLAVLYDLVKNGEFVSEFAAEKVAYFLQRFGAGNVFKLQFTPHFYGPYSGKVKHVLHYLNGSYIAGYSAKSKKPFEEMGLVADAEDDVNKYLELPEYQSYKAIAEQTKNFLSGYYSSFALELLSTIDFIMTEKKAATQEEIKAFLLEWSDRKRTLFDNQRFIDLAFNHLKQHLN